MTDTVQNFQGFQGLELDGVLLRALKTLHYETPTPIQQQAIPPLMQGRDVLGCAQTGTGKTAAFALPLLHHLLREERAPAGKRLRVLVLAPTRELALQIDESFRQYGQFTPVRPTVIFGGVGQGPQVDALRRGVDVLVATPGRLLDLHGQGLLDLRAVQYLVLDEADRMLDMGFVRDVRRIVGLLPNRKQTLLFSATMAPEIRTLASELLTNPVSVAVTPAATTVEAIAQSVFHVHKAQKRLLLEKLLGDPAVARCIVFTRTKHGADKVALGLGKAGIKAAAIHGNRSQSQRVRALEGFKAGDIRVLVATDIAARGLDIDAVSHVINYELPNEPDSYVHRIGRTARNGATGIAWAMCDSEERGLLRDIEKRIQQKVPVASVADFGMSVDEFAAPPVGAEPEERRAHSPRQQQRQPHAQGRRGGAHGEHRSGGGGASQRGSRPGPERDARPAMAAAPSPAARAPVAAPRAEPHARVDRDWY